VGGSVTYALVRGLLVVTLIGLTLAAAGCGSKAQPKRSALAEQIAQICDTARAKTEALGLPGDKGFAVVAPTAAIGLRMAKQLKQLRGTSPAKKEQIDSLAEGFRFYYGEMAAGAKLYNAGYRDGYAATIERAKSVLTTAEALAVRMGAPECAVRAFSEK
jgi:hypothetical protein